MPVVEDVLAFLKSFKTRKEIQEKFNMSDTQVYHLLRWLKKSRSIEEIPMRVAGVTNRVVFYKTRAERKE